MGKRGPKPKGQVKIEWNVDFAYAIGLITTDGCLYNDKRHISFVSKDLDLVETFKRILGLKVKIGMKINTKGTRTPHIQFGDVQFYQFLESIGLTAAKSKILGKVNIPDEHFFDFLRGCLDGDGCIYSYWDKRWRSSFMFYTSFCSGSLKHLEWLRSEIFQKLKIKGHMDIDKKRSFYQLKYAKSDSMTLWEAMYYKGVKSYMERKKLKIISALAMIGQPQERSLTI